MLHETYSRCELTPDASFYVRDLRYRNTSEHMPLNHTLSLEPSAQRPPKYPTAEDWLIRVSEAAW